MVSFVAQVIRGAERAVIFSARVGRKLIGSVWPTGAILLILFGVGLFAAAVRIELIRISPWIAEHSKLVAGIWNVWAESVQIAIDAVQIVAYGIKVVGQVIVDVIEGVPYEELSPPTLVRFTKITPDEVERTFNKIPVECVPYSGGWPIIKGILRQTVGHDTCRLLRNFQPTNLDPALSALVGFASDGDYVPKPYGDNCEVPYPAMPWFCVPFGSAFLILELLLPLLLFTIILIAGLSAWKSDRTDQAKYTTDRRLDTLEDENKKDV